MKRKIILALAVATTLTIVNTFTKPAIALSADGGTILENGEGTGENDNDEGPTFPSSNIQSKKVIISSVDLSKNVIEPGEEFTLTYTLTNNTYSRLYNVSLKLVGVEGKGTLDGFVPVGTTNEIYIGSIPASSKKEVSITLCSDSNIKPGAYNFVTSVMYNQMDKEQEEISKLSGVMIKSKPQLDLSGVDAFPNGAGYSIGGSVINSGTTRVKNATVKVKFNGEELIYNIGAMDVEAEEMFEIMAPAVEEDTTAEVEVTYEDNSGNTYSTQGNCVLRAIIMDENFNIAPEIPEVEEKGGFWNFVKNLFRLGV